MIDYHKFRYIRETITEADSELLPREGKELSATIINSFMTEVSII